LATIVPPRSRALTLRDHSQLEHERAQLKLLLLQLAVRRVVETSEPRIELLDERAGHVGVRITKHIDDVEAEPSR
jgi:hypothetical protein